MNTKKLSEHNYSGVLDALSRTARNYPDVVAKLMHYSIQPIEKESEIIERAEMMGLIMDMATDRSDVILVFAHAMEEQIEKFEREIAKNQPKNRCFE